MPSNMSLLSDYDDHPTGDIALQTAAFSVLDVT